MDGVSGLVNVDLTPDIAVRLAAALGTALKRGARVVASREGGRACRMIKRAMISGLASTGVDVADLRVIPAGVARHLVKSESFAAGFHVGISPNDPEAIRIQFFEAPGIEMSAGRCRRRSRSTSRAASCAASPRGRWAAISYPARVSESYANDLLEHARRRRDSRARLPARRRLRLLRLVLRAPARARPARGRGRSPRTRSRARATAGRPAASRRRSARRSGSCSAVGADLGAVFDRAGERLYLIDEQAREIPVEQALLLYLRLIALERPHRQARLPRDRDEPGRPAHRGHAARDRPHARVAAGADAGGRRGGRRLRRRGGRRLRLPRVPARPTTPSRASRSCSSCSRRSTGRSRSSWPSCRRRRSSTGRSRARGR